MTETSFRGRLAVKFGHAENRNILILNIFLHNNNPKKRSEVGKNRSISLKASLRSAAWSL